MAIRVMIKRLVPAEKEKDLVSLVTELRSTASKQPGYISGETLRHFQKPDEYLVISTWHSVEDWTAWIVNPIRKALQEKIDKLLGKQTSYDIYHYPETRYIKAELQ